MFGTKQSVDGQCPDPRTRKDVLDLLKQFDFVWFRTRAAFMSARGIVWLVQAKRNALSDHVVDPGLWHCLTSRCTIGRNACRFKTLESIQCVKSRQTRTYPKQEKHNLVAFECMSSPHLCGLVLSLHVAYSLFSMAMKMKFARDGALDSHSCLSPLLRNAGQWLFDR